MTETMRNAIRKWQKNVKHEPMGELTAEERAQLRRGTGARLSGLEPSLAPGSRRRRAGRPARAGWLGQLQGCDRIGLWRVGFSPGTVRCTYWGACAILRPTLGQAIDLALGECGEQATKPAACGIRLTFCADGGHKP